MVYSYFKEIKPFLKRFILFKDLNKISHKLFLANLEIYFTDSFSMSYKQINLLIITWSGNKKWKTNQQVI